jgi:two-component system sensor histidine kinase VicK
MSAAAAAQLQFAAGFAVFLVAGAGLTLLLVRGDLLVDGIRSRGPVAAGFVLVAAGAFAQSVGIVDDVRSPSFAAVRLIGVALLAIAPVHWAGSALGRLSFAAGIASLVAAEALLALEADVVSDWLRLVGAAGLGAGIFLAARRSIPTRIAISASAILLVVVVAVSVGLSAVLADNVENEAVARLAARADTEASLAKGAAATADGNASLGARALTGSAAAAPAIGRLATTPGAATEAQDQATVTDALGTLVNDVFLGFDPRVGPVLLVGQSDLRLLAVAGPNGVLPAAEVLAGLQANDVVLQAARTDGPTQSVVTAGSLAYGLAASPVPVADIDGRRANVAILVVASQLDDSFLEARLAVGPDAESSEEGAALTSRSEVLAVFGALPPSTDVLALGVRALSGEAEATATTNDRLLAASPVLANDDEPVLALVTATSTASIQAARADLFRLLFLIAIGGTVLALVLTAIVGERIGAGLGRLTVAAGEVTHGNLGVTADVHSDDELGVLSDAFDSMTGSLRSMTADLRRAVDDEARLRTRMEAVVGGMGEALVAVDDRGDVTDFNAAAELLSGVPAGKAIGRPASTVMQLVADDGADLGPRFGPPLEDAWSTSATLLHATGLEVPVVLSAGVLRGSQNQVVGAVYVLRDVRREREIERVKGELLSNISHELRTPLTPIKAYSQILRQKDVSPDDVRTFATEIEKASASMERVVVKLVNFAAMSAGRYEVRVELTVVREVVDRVVGQWTDRVDPDRHPVTRRIGRGVPKVWLDRQEVAHALNELLDNAVKYSPDGGRIEVKAAAATDRDGREVVRLSVADRGVGIPADRLDDVAGDFIQADGSNTRSFGGLGLGLALASRIARAHGGELEISSTSGLGTTVTLVVPVAGPDGGAL